MKLIKGDKLVLIGDSITDAGRNRPDGEGLGDALGGGYVALIEALLTSTYPELGIRVVNRGNSGNTVRDLKDRWQEDVIDAKPDWLAIMIGVNDIWRQFDSPTRPEGHVYIDEYEETLDALVTTTKPLVKGLVLMTPHYMEPNPADAMRAEIDKYGRVVEKLAKKHDTLFVDTQAAFNHVLKYIYPATLGWDRVHPGKAGHMVLARAFLNAIDYKW
ncbi:MAG TPA: SGNH/GDSL hydrolase family protein [Capsulimonadaceae bacterium]|jgi:lysophospholipase L1-like esterase